MATTTVAKRQKQEVDQKVTPNQSLYLQNLPEKIQKDDLRRALYMLFSTYGPVIDVNAIRAKSMRGQAHVLFRDTQTAMQAMRACQGFEFFGKEMRISYSKNRSDTLSKLTGTFVSPISEQSKTAPPPSSFPAPPGQAPLSSLPAPPSGLPPPPGMAPQANGSASGLQAPPSKADNAPSPQGTKRPHDSDEEGADMEEDDDDDEGAMEMSDEDD